MKHILWVVGLAVLMLNPIGYAGPKSVGSGGQNPATVNLQDGAKQQRLAQKTLQNLRQRQQKSKKQAMRVDRLFNPRQRKQFAEIRTLASRAARNPRGINQLKSKWSQFIQKVAQKDPHVDIDALVQAAMFELYQQEIRSLERVILQVHRLNNVKRQTRKEFNRARKHHRKMSVKQRDGSSIPAYRPEKRPGVKSKSAITSSEAMKSYIEDMEKKLNTIGEDAQLANIDLQNALQRQQQLIQTLSNISKILHDTALAVIRKIG